MIIFWLVCLVLNMGYVSINISERKYGWAFVHTISGAASGALILRIMVGSV